MQGYNTGINATVVIQATINMAGDPREGVISSVMEMLLNFVVEITITLSTK